MHCYNNDHDDSGNDDDDEVDGFPLFWMGRLGVCWHIVIVPFAVLSNKEIMYIIRGHSEICIFKRGGTVNRLVYKLHSCYIK